MRRRWRNIAGSVVVFAVVLTGAMFGRRPPPTPGRPAAPANIASTTPARAAAIEPLAGERWLVVNVHDGDTVRRLDADKVQHRVRL
jgi:hypothetical protein